MTTLNPNTKKAQNMIASFIWARPAAMHIMDAYDRPSRAKFKAWMDCVELCERMGGYALCIVGHNSMTFSAAFEYENGIVYITKSKTYLIPKNA